MSKRIAFIRIFDSVPIAYSVERMIKESFPEYPVDTIVLTKLLKSNPHIMFLSVFPMLWFYGLDLLRGKKKPRGAFFATPFMFKQVKRLVNKKIKETGEEYLFSFQLQSLFDTSTGSMPHFVYTDHTHLANLEYEDFDQARLYSDTWLRLEKLIYQRATKIFTRSTNISHSLMKQYDVPEEKISCIYVGVNVNEELTQQPKTNYDEKNILFVGIDWERKGGPTLLEAFSQLVEKHPDATLTIVGAAPETDIPNCEVVGLIPVEEVHQYYQKATIFCLPTTLEPFGVVFVEAMAYKLPIVGTRIGAIPDFVVEDHNGYLMTPHSTDELYDALLKLLDDGDKRCRFGQNSYKLAMERYNWDQVGQAARQEIAAIVAL